MTQQELNARIPLSLAQWHVHLNIVCPAAARTGQLAHGDTTFGLNGSIATTEAGSAAGSHFNPHLAGWMTHIYPFETDAAKVCGAGMGDEHAMEHNSYDFVYKSVKEKNLVENALMSIAIFFTAI